MSRLDAIRAKGWRSHQLMLQAKATGDVLLAAEADAQAVVERLRRGPVKLLPLEGVITAEEAARLLTEAFHQSRRMPLISDAEATPAYLRARGGHR